MAPGPGKIPALAEEAARLEAGAGTAVAVLVGAAVAADELEAMAVTAGRRRKSRGTPGPQDNCSRSPVHCRSRRR
jgi:hypothetical protein